MPDFSDAREEMVRHQLRDRGITNENVLRAMSTVPREQFVPPRFRRHAYDDGPLPIGEGQTISQPAVVAMMIEQAGVQPGDRVLEVGAGCGYAAAVMGRIAGQVYAIEWHADLAEQAKQRMRDLDYSNVEVIQGDGSGGLPEAAPFDAIIVSAGGPEVPEALCDQLRVGGRLVVPVGQSKRSQELIVVQRSGKDTFDRQSLGEVSFVPLIGRFGWDTKDENSSSHQSKSQPDHPPPKGSDPDEDLVKWIANHAEPFEEIERCDLSKLLDRIGKAKVVLIGEASHGTSEFYRFRAQVTRQLIENHGFDIVALEADWPDTAVFNAYAQHRSPPDLRNPAFSRFPVWMWRNQETLDFVRWLKRFNAETPPPDDPVGIYGLDLYSLNNSIGQVLDYLGEIDPEQADVARRRYACFSPWEDDPAMYGRTTTANEVSGTCEREAVSILTNLYVQRMAYIEQDGDRFFDATRNAVVVREAERYYRQMYRGARESWNLRDRHMFDTLQSLLEHRGSESKAVVWAHNSHIGDARATSMGMRGEINLGQLAREHFGSQAQLIGMGTDHGTVAAADNWDLPMQVMDVKPSLNDSYEALCHRAPHDRFILPLQQIEASDSLADALHDTRLQRAIGVIYRPATERMSHYFETQLAQQFDEYIWFDSTRAVDALRTESRAGPDATFPAGL